jgi:DNA-binding XRE family transcriptional regulator
MKPVPSLPTATDLKARRKALGLSQAELAQIIHCHVQTIYRFERGIHAHCHRLRFVLDQVLTAIETSRPVQDEEVRRLVLEGK